MGPCFIHVYKRKTMVKSIWSCLRQPRLKRTSLSKLDNWLPETDRQSWRLQPQITIFFCEYLQNWAGPITKLRIMFMNVDLPLLQNTIFIFVREHFQIKFLKRTRLVTWTFTRRKFVYTRNLLIKFDPFCILDRTQ